MVYTRTGDKGKTGLFGGSKVSKDDLRVCCYGAIDEANSNIAAARAALTIPSIKEHLLFIQKKMFVIGAEIASDERGYAQLKEKITEKDVLYLEKIIDNYTEQFGKLKGFTIPGETLASSFLHIARTTVRKAERYLVALAKVENVSFELCKYINRLSDCLYVLALQEVYLSFEGKVVEKLKNYEGRNQNINSSDLLNKMGQRAIDESARLGVPICFAVVDKSGVLTYFKRLPNALLASVKLAQKKAYTAVALKMTSGQLKSLANSTGDLYGISHADNQIVIFGGGFPLFVNGEIVGGIGISGGTVAEDEQIGNKVLEVFNEETKDFFSGF